MFFFNTIIVILLLSIVLKCSGINPNNLDAINNYAVSLNTDVVGAPSGETKNNYQQFPYHPHHQHHHDHLPHHHRPDFHHFHPDPHYHYHTQHRYPEGHFYEHAGKPSFEDSLPKNSNTSSIPLDLIRKFNNFSEINDLLINLVEGQTQDEAPVLEDRFSPGERSAAIVPKSAACMPELQTVKIVSNDDPSILYVPSCTRLERCGGCCSHSLLSCQPTDIETVSFQVVKTQFVGGSKLKFMGKEVVLVDRHTKCKCDCKVQEKDCNKFQDYRKSECRCACTNIDEEKKCYKENITKLWNPEICACECRNILQCSTGYTFDTIRCRCMPVYIRRRYAEISEHDQEKTHYQTDGLPVVPLVEGESLKDSL